MSRRFLFALLLGALVSAASAAPGHGLVPRAAAASCSGWSSNSTPPPSIRVYRHASGAVETVDFKAYTKNVLSREWISSWTTESLRSGALAVKNYAWYQVLHWRGGTSAAGACFDLRDDTWDQVYDPDRPTYSTAAAAVDTTWTTLVLKNGAIFATYYNAGDVGEACGANANGWKAFQWGTQACGLAGQTAAQIILTYYYPGVTVTDPGSPATPTPVPTATATPTPVPTATPTPAQTSIPSPTAVPTSSPSATPTPTVSPSPAVTPSPTQSATPSPTPVPTAVPTPTPSATPTPLPPPPADQQLPGGGQAGVQDASTPPAPPPADPEPVVASPVPLADARSSMTARLSLRRWSAVLERLRLLDAGLGMGVSAFQEDHLEAGMHGGVLMAGSRVVGMHDAAPLTDLRLATFPVMWDRAIDDLMAALGRQLRTITTASRTRFEPSLTPR